MSFEVFRFQAPDERDLPDGLPRRRQPREEARRRGGRPGLPGRPPPPRGAKKKLSKRLKKTIFSSFSRIFYCLLWFYLKTN